MPPRSGSRRSAADARRADELVTLFAYHRDVPLVARALGYTLDQLEEEIERIGVRKQMRQLLRGTDADLPLATTGRAAAGPPVRRRAARPAAQQAVAPPPTPPAPPPLAPRTPVPLAPERATPRAAKVEKARRPKAPVPPRPPSPRSPPPRSPPPVPAPKNSGEQSSELLAILREVGPRRRELASRLAPPGSPLSIPALLARFRLAGLEREFGQRERDLLRGLLSRHHGALSMVAGEMGLAASELQGIVQERGLAREFEAFRESERKKARAARWPGPALRQLVHSREWLADLGLLGELEGEARPRVRSSWKALGAKPTLAALARELGLAEPDAQRLRERFDLPK